MARIDDVDLRKVGFFSRLFLRLAYWFSRRKVGKVVGPLRVVGHHRRVLFGYGMMEQALGSCHALEPSLKSLASIRVATRVGCAY